MFGFFGNNKEEKVMLPMNGTVIPAASIPDATFAQEMMGPTLGIEPSDGAVKAPFDGTVENVFDTKHALTLTSAEGMELLIHVGIETVALRGEPFTAHVRDGQQVKKGDLLLTADLTAIRAAGLSAVTPVVICNADEYKRITGQTDGKNTGDVLFLAEKG